MSCSSTIVIPYTFSCGGELITWYPSGCRCSVFCHCCWLRGESCCFVRGENCCLLDGMRLLAASSRETLPRLGFSGWQGCCDCTDIRLGGSKSLGDAVRLRGSKSFGDVVRLRGNKPPSGAAGICVDTNGFLCQDGGKVVLEVTIGVDSAVAGRVDAPEKARSMLVL